MLNFSQLTVCKFPNYGTSQQTMKTEIFLQCYNKWVGLYCNIKWAVYRNVYHSSMIQNKQQNNFKCKIQLSEYTVGVDPNIGEVRYFMGVAQCTNNNNQHDEFFRWGVCDEQMII